MALNVGTAIAYLELDTSKFTKGFRSAYEDVKVFRDRTATVEQKLNGLSSAMSNVGSVLSKTVTLPIVGIGTAAVAASKNFESSMSQVRAIANATGEEFDLLHDKALELGASTTFSASEVADAMTEMAKAGWTTQDILDGMQGVLDATAASGENLATVSTIVADAITTFGLSVSESTRVADLLSQAANAGTISVSDLGESLKYIGPIANTMGFSIEDVTTAITAMSEAGIKGSQAGTSLRMMFTRLFKPTDQVRDAMNELGIVIADEQGNFKDMDTILKEMRGTFRTLTPEQQAYYAATLAGAEASSGLISILNMTQAEYDAIAATMDNATGSAERTAEVMKDNLAGALEELGGAFETAGISIGEVLTPYIRNLAEWIANLVNKFNSLSEEEQNQIVKIGAVVAAIGPALLIFSRLASVISGVITAAKAIPGIFSAIVKAIGGISAPVLAVSATVGTLVAAFATLWKTNEEFRNNITNTWNQIKQTFSNFFDGVTERINAFGFDFENITQVLSAAWTTFCNILTPVFEGAFSIIGTVLDGVLDAILSLLDVVIGLFTGDTAQLQKGVENFFTGIIDSVFGLVQTILNTIGGLGSRILSAFGLEGAAEQFRLFFENIGNHVNGIGEFFTVTIPGFFRNFEENSKALVENVSQWFSQLPGRVGEALGTLAANIINTLVSVQDWLGQKVPEIIEGVITWFSELPGRMQEVFNSIIQKLIEWKDNFFEFIGTEIPVIIENLVSFFSDLPERFMEIGSNVISGLWQGIQNVWEGLKTGVSDFCSGFVNGFKNALDINSPSKRFEELGDMSLAGLFKPFENLAGFQQITIFAEALLNAIRVALNPEQFAEIMNEFLNSGMELFQSWGQNISTLGSQVGKMFVTGFVTPFVTMNEQLTELLNMTVEVMTSWNEVIGTLISTMSFNFIGTITTQFSRVPTTINMYLMQAYNFTMAWSMKMRVLATQTGNLFIQNLFLILNTLPNKIMQLFLQVVQIIITFREQMYQAGIAIMTELLNAMQQMGAKILSYVSSLASDIIAQCNRMTSALNSVIAKANEAMSAASSVDGSHANGLDYVPFNGYIAELHKGERVLTRQENEDYNNSRSSGSGSGDTFVFYNTQPNPYEYARQMKRAKRELMNT